MGFKKYLAALGAAVALVLSIGAGAVTPTVATAAENSEMSTYGTTYTKVVLDQYSNLYMGYGPINANVWVEPFNINSHHQIDVRMVDKNGDVIWEEIGAMKAGSPRKFWCGPDVYLIQGRTSSADLFGNLTARISYCNVWLE